MVTVALDEHTSSPIVIADLAELGIQAVRIVDVLGQGHHDPALLAWSAFEDVPLVTLDKRIRRHVWVDGYRRHAGIIVVDYARLGILPVEVAPFIAMAALHPWFLGTARQQYALVTADDFGNAVVLWGDDR